jgi:hypothetical protein
MMPTVPLSWWTPKEARQSVELHPAEASVIAKQASIGNTRCD